MEKIRRQKYQIIMMMVVLVIGVIGLINIKNYDRYSGEIKVQNAYVSKVSGSINEANATSTNTIKSTDEVMYEINYTITGDETRAAEIKASLSEEEAKYASFEKIESENITSVLSEDRKEITINIKEAKPNVQNKVVLRLEVKNAPNNFKLNPQIEIKEETDSEYTKVSTSEVIVETRSVTGIIRDETKNGVSNVEVKILNENKEEIKRTYTDNDGRYTFSDLNQGKYYVELEEDRFVITSPNEIQIDTSEVLDIEIKEVNPFEINVKKYIRKVRINDKEYTYGEIEKVNQAVKNLKEIEGEIEYKVVVSNKGNKEGVITRVKEDIGEGLSFTPNNGWIQKGDYIYNESLEGITLKAGEEKTLKLVLKIDKTAEAKNYLSKVTVKGEIYEKVSYVLNNEIYKELEVLEGEKIEEEKLLDAEGKKFSGWYTDKNYTNKYNFDNEVTKDLILYGKYEEETQKYIVKFIDEGKIIETKEYEEGSLIIKPEDPSKEGYTFTGWYENNVKYDLNTPVYKDVTLESKYEINKYKVTFKNYDGTILQETEEEYNSLPTYKGETPAKPSTEEYRYEFSVWNKELTSVKSEQEYIAEYKETKRIYTVTYIDEGKIETEDYEYGSVVTEKILTKEGYTFVGWYEKDEKVTFPLTVTRNITLESKYKINKYTVKYYHNKESYKEGKYDEEVEYKGTATRPEEDPSKEDYNFVGWVIKDTDTLYTFTEEVTKDIELESKFEAKPVYEVRFEIDGELITSVNVVEGKTVNKPSDPSKAGYVFDKWYNEETLLTEYDFENTVITENKTIYGKWNENAHTVTYINDGITYEEEKVLDSFSPVGPSKGNPSKEGYTFKYWSQEEDGQTEVDVTSLVITGDISLYAVYEINTYTVTFKNYDGTVLQETEEEYNTLPEYNGETPVKESTDEYTYTFDKWSPEITEVKGDQEYIATYTETKNKYTVTFINYDGTELQSEELEYGVMPVYKGETPTRESTEENTYTFSGWNEEISIVTGPKVYEAQYEITKNKYTVTFVDEGTTIEEKEVEYGSVVTETTLREEKEHKIFRYWMLDNNEYDFNTPVTEDITLVSYYEVVEAPIVSHTPTLPDWTKEKVVVTIGNETHPEYTYKYKIDEGEYQDYTGEFEVYENSVVVAKSIKENVESEITTHEITNIDKVDPNILSIEETSIMPTSIELEVKGQDNESGLNYIKIYKENSEGTYEELITQEYNGNEEKELIYTLSNLEELTTYKVKIELIDKVGNTSFEEKEITTIEKTIVAKIIGRDGTLNSTLIEEAIAEAESNLAEGETLTEEELQEIYARYPDERYENLEAAIEACGENQCTIQMVLSTEESIEVLETQNITLDLNGQTVEGTKSNTIINRGSLTIVDNADVKGSIISNNDAVISNIEGASLSIGVDDDTVSTDSPNIVGAKVGIESKGTLNFFDGRIEGGSVAIDGVVSLTPYLYNARVTSASTEVATLTILAEAEARINTTYYTKVGNALDESKSGYYDEELQSSSLIENVVKSNTYGFYYNEETGTLKNTNQEIANSVANSYIKIDLTDYTTNQVLTINAEVNSQSNSDVGYATITETIDVPVYNNTSGRFIYIHGTVAAQDYNVPLKAGKVYYLHFGYKKDNSTNTGDDTFTINSINLSSVSLSENIQIITPSTYGFELSPELIPTNSTVASSTAHSYITVDMTNEIEDKTIVVNAESNMRSNNYSWITITNSETAPKYSTSSGRFLYINGIDTAATDYTGTLKAGEINYIHISYYNRYVDEYYPFTINSITIDEKNILDYIMSDSPYITDEVTMVPVLNEQVDSIELLKTITLTEPMEIEETKDVVLDLRGQTLTTTSTDYIIKNNGSLTITDSKYSDDVESAQNAYEQEQAIYDNNYAIDTESYNNYVSEQNELLNNEYLEETEKYKDATTDSYVKDSLVLQFDGIEKGNTDNVWEDLSGNGNNGTINGATWTDDNGLSFDGVDDYVDLGKQNYDNITLEAIVTFNNYETRQSIFNNQYYGGYELWINASGKIGGTLGISSSGNWYNVYGTNAEKTKAVYTLTYDGTQEKIYINGELIGINDITGKIYAATNNTKLSLGARNSSEGIQHNLNGIIYSARMYSKALTEEEVKQNYYIDNVRYNLGARTYRETNQISTTTSNFTQTTTNTSYGKMTSNGSNQLYMEAASSNYNSVTYLNEKIVLDENDTYTISGNLIYNNSGYSSDVATIYIGLSKTNEIDTQDFGEYIKINVNSTTEASKDFKLLLYEKGEYYFKIVTIFESGGTYPTKLTLNNLNYTRKPERKQAVLADTTLQGNITSTTGSVIYNNVGANLVIDKAIINASKSGNGALYNSAIRNYGTLSLNKDSHIYANMDYTTGIRNEASGLIDKTDGKIYTYENYAYGIYNLSSVQKQLSNLDIENWYSGIGLYNKTPYDNTLSIKNSKFTGSGSSITAHTGNIEIDSSEMSSSGSIINTYDNETNYIKIYNSNLKSTGSNSTTIYSNGFDMQIDNSKLEHTYTAGRLIYFNSRTVSINNSELISKDEGINISSSNNKEPYLKINGNTTIDTVDDSIYNSAATSEVIISDNVIIKSADIAVNNYQGTLTIEDNVKIESTNYGISNSYLGTTNIKDNVVINAKYGIATGTNETGIINIGEKDGVVNTEYPKIISSEYGIYSATNRGITQINFYDGRFTSKLDSSINSVIYSIEDDNDLVITKSTDTEDMYLGSEYVASIGDNQFTSIQAAIDSITSEDEVTITLLKNITTAKRIINDKNIVLDLNGKTIDTYYRYEYITNNNKFTLKDSSTDETGVINSIYNVIMVNNNDAVIENGRINNNSSMTSFSLVHNYGNLDINDCNIYVLNSASGLETIVNYENATFNMNGGVIESKNAVLNNGTFNFKNGEIKMKNTSHTTLVNNTNILNITDGIITNTATSNYGYAIKNSGTANIENLTINRIGIGIDNAGQLTVNNIDIKASGTGINNSGLNGNVVVNNGSIISTNQSFQNSNTSSTATSTITIYDGTYQGQVYNNSVGTINMVKGTYTSTNTEGVYNYRTGTINIGTKGDTNEDGTLNVSKTNPSITGKTYGVRNYTTGLINFYDGIITGPTDKAIYGNINELEDGYEITKTIDETTSTESKFLDILPVAEIYDVDGNLTELQCGIDEYAACYNIQDAILAAGQDETIKITRNVTLVASNPSIEIPDTKKINIDLNGFNITAANENSFINNGVLKFIDSSEDSLGVLESTTTNLIQNNNELEIASGTYQSAGAVAIIDNYGLLTVSGGTIYHSVSNTVNGYDVSSIHNNENATLNVTNGTISMRCYGNVILNDGVFNLSGGTINFEGYNGSSYGENKIIKNNNELSVTGGTLIDYGSIGNGIANYGTATINNLTIQDVSYDALYNEGTMTVNNIDIQSSSNSINNRNTGEITINNGTLVGKVYNNGTGTINLVSGTYTGMVENYSTGIINIGKEDGSYTGDSLSITSTKEAILNKSTGTVNYYDGTIKGTTIFDGPINDIETGYNIKITTEDTLQVATQEKGNIVKIGTIEYASIEEALLSSDCSDGKQCTIDLITNLIVPAQNPSVNIESEKNVIFNLNGYTITTSNTNFFENNGTLKIIDTAEVKGSIISENDTIILNNGTFESDGANFALNTNYQMNNGLIINDGTMTLSNSNVECNQNYCMRNKNDGLLTVVNSILKAPSHVIYNQDSAEIIIESGEVTATYDYSGIAIYLYSGTVTINNGTIKGNSAIYTYTTDSIVNVNAGNIGSIVLYNATEVNIKGGTISSINNSGNSTATINIEAGNFTRLLNQKGTVNITGGIFEDSSSNTIITNNGTMTITNADIISTSTSTNCRVIDNGGTLDISNATITSNSKGIYTQYTASITNIRENVVITAGDTAIYIENGTINIGTQDRVVSIEAPSITGTKYGIYNASTSGKIYFYDGKIVGAENQSIYGVVTDVEPGYKIKSDTVDGMTTSTLTVIGTEERVAVVNGMNFSSLQSAINAATNDTESDVVLYSNITLDSNITVPSNKIIKLYLNGFTINYGNYNFTGEGKLTIVNTDDSEETILGSIVNLVKEALDINDISKKIVIYEMDDGSKLLSNKTYRLYKDGELVKVEEDSIGRYSIGTGTEDMRTVRGRLYINDISEGEYEIIDNDGKKVSFTISEEGQVYGTAKENVVKERVIEASAIAELIISMQTGVVQGRYILLITLISIIGILLFLIKRQKSIN